VELFNGFDSNYRYILVAARRARQLQSGARPKVETPSRKPCRIAEQEIAAEKVTWFIPDKRTPVEKAAEALSTAPAPEPEE
jgi:DNA-directed RNA polymerase subunit omega